MVCCCEPCLRREDEYNKKKTALIGRFTQELSEADQQHIRKRQSLELSHLRELRELEEAKRRESELEECQQRQINAQLAEVSVRECEN